MDVKKKLIQKRNGVNTIKANYNDKNWDEVLSLLQELVALESCSSQGKRSILEYVAKYLGEVENEIVDPPGVDPYLIARICSKDKETFTLILEGHLDTVDPGGMINPFFPIIKEGRLYGRGACDMKSGCAALICAFKEYAKIQETGGNVILVLVTDEETSGAGITHALRNSLPKGDLGIVAEPTELKMGIAHKGIEWAEVSVFGKACHSSIPENGINSINMATRLIQTMEEYAKTNLARRGDPVLGLPTWTIGSIRGGGEFPNTVPDLCKFRIDRRWNPCESIEDVWHDFDACINMCREKDPNFNASWERFGVTSLEQVFLPLSFPQKGPLFERISTLLGNTEKLDVETIALPYWTEGSLLQKFGTPTFILGPGSVNLCHSSEEYVEIVQPAIAAQVYFSLICKTCLG